MTTKNLEEASYYLDVHGPREPFSIKDSPEKTPEAVDHPDHYNEHPSGIECVDVVEWMSFNLGNAMKYLWRASLKGQETQDLKKAIWYIQRELQRFDALTVAVEELEE